MRFVSIAFSLSSWSTPLWGQTILQNVYRPAAHVWLGGTPAPAPRQIVSLNGTWQAACSAPNLAGPVEVPGGFLFEGEMRFERTFRLADSLQQRPVRLHLNGLNHEAHIVINGNMIASHTGGYTSFVLELRSEPLRFGQDNVMAITVDNRLSPLGSLPPQHRPMGWRNEGGMIREIYLEILPEIYFANEEFKPQWQSDGAYVEFRAQTRARHDLSPEAFANLTATLEIWDAERRNRLAVSPAQPLAAGPADRQEVRLGCRLPNAALWSPAAPNLYAVRAVLERERFSGREKSTVDELWQETGFRQVAIENNEMRLNGELLILRGVNWIEEYGGRAALLDTARLQNLLATLKRLGANALRVVGHPPHPLLPVLCDRAGIFLLEEPPFYHLTDAHYRQPRFAQIAKLQLFEMVQRDRCHPSVLAWGLGVSGMPASSAAQKTVKELAATLRSLDSRFVYAVTAPAWQRLWESTADFLLVEWLKKGNLDSLIFLQEQHAKLLLPVLGHYVSPPEAGTSGDLGAVEIRREEEAQAEYYARVFKTLRERPRAGGYFLHALSDWEGPMPYLGAGASAPAADHSATVEWEPSDWSELAFVSGTRMHPWGLMTAEGRQRTAFSVVQAYNHHESGPVLGTRRLPPPHPGVFQITGIMLILSFLFFLQRDRRLRASLRRVFVHPHGFYHDLYEHRKVAPFLTLVVGLTVSAITAFLLAQFCYAFRQSLVFDQCLNLLLDEASWKAAAIWLIWHPGGLMFWGTLAVFGFGLALGFLFRLLGMLFGTSPPLSQFVASVYWSWANLLLLGALTPVFYRLLLNSDAWRPLLMLIFAFAAWLIVRLFRAIRVMYMVSYFRAAVIFIGLFGGLSLAAWLYFERTRAFTEYAKYYLSMLRVIG